MTNKESIEELKPLTKYSIDKNGVVGTFPMVWRPEQVEALNLAIKALEEQERPTGEWIETAKEYYEAVNERGGGVDEHTPVEKWECVEDDNYAGGGYWECPSCKTRFSFRGFNMLNDMPYCPRCGNRVKTELEAENEQVR